MAARQPSPLRALEIGDTISFLAPTGKDVVRYHRNAFQFGERNERRFKGKIDRKTRVLTFTRVE